MERVKKIRNYSPPLLIGACGTHGKGVCRHGRRQSNGHGRRKVALGMGASRHC